MTEKERLLHTRPSNREAIRLWVDYFLSFKVHDTCRCVETDLEVGKPHQSQLDYIADGFLGAYSSAVFVAARNAGKSYAAAVLILLDCWFKPGIKVAVAAYQRNQSDYIYRYMTEFLDILARNAGKVPGSLAKISKDDIVFPNGSSARFFSGGKSTAGVKGYHPNILVVDECDLFSQEQFDGIANALEAGGEFQRRFDVLSTNYTVSGDGVVLNQIKRYEEFNRKAAENPALKPCKVYRTCLIDILSKCDDRFQCSKCDLWNYCKGRAKEGEGFYKIESAIETVTNSSLATFESQMLLLRPTNEHSYFKGFTTQHIVEFEWRHDLIPVIAFDFGAGRSPHAAVLAFKENAGKGSVRTDPGQYWVLDEFHCEGNLDTMIFQIKQKYPLALEADCKFDPKGKERPHMQQARSYMDLLKKAGWHPICTGLKRDITFKQIDMLISPASGPPRLHIHPQCKRLIRQLQAAEHKVVNGHISDDPADIRPDDQLDCLRYVVGNTWGTYAKKCGQKHLVFW